MFGKRKRRRAVDRASEKPSEFYPVLTCGLCYRRYDRSGRISDCPDCGGSPCEQDLCLSPAGTVRTWDEAEVCS